MTGNTWTSVRFFSTFEEADTLRSSLKRSDTSGTLQVKIKRCAEGGSTYVVKTRQSAEIVAATQTLEEEIQTNNTKPVKKTRKSKQ